MHWILLAIVGIALIALASRYPKSAFALLGVLLLAGLVFYQTNSFAPTAKSKPLQASDISLDQMLMTQGYQNGFNLSGRISNHSKEIAISEFVIKVAMRDCASGDSGGHANECPIIGEKLERIKLLTPPEQSRDFSESLYFDRAKVRGEIRWKFEIVEVSGR